MTATPDPAGIDMEILMAEIAQERAGDWLELVQLRHLVKRQAERIRVLETPMKGEVG